MKKSVTKFTLAFSMPIRPFKLAELKKNKNEDLETPWYVEYHIFSLDENRLVRRRKVLRQNTKEKRIKSADLMINAINKKLLSGAILKNGEEYKEPSEMPDKKEQIQTESETKNVVDPDDITAEAAIIQFIATKKRTVRKSTMETYNTHVKGKFFRFCEARGILKEPIKNFTSTLAHEYLDELAMNPEYSNRVVNNSRGAVTTLFSFVIDRADKKWINPFKSTKKLAALKQKHTAFTDNQVGEMIEAMQAEEYRHLYLFVSFMFYCFLRPHEEVRNIQVKDIDIKKRSLILKAAAAKNGKQEHVRIPDAFLEIIKESKVLENPDHYYLFSNKNCPGPKPASKHFMYRRHSQVLEKCGLSGQNIDLYSWKHTGVCALFRATQNVEVIREQARFADMNTCMHYLRDLGLFIDYGEVNKMPRLKDFRKKNANI